MSKKLDNILESEIKRFKDILKYQDTLSLNEVSYRFYNEADENQPEDANAEGDDAEVSDEDLTAAMDDVSGGGEEEAPAEEPVATDDATAPEDTEGAEGDEMVDDTSAEAAPEEETVEVSEKSLSLLDDLFGSDDEEEFIAPLKTRSSSGPCICKQSWCRKASRMRRDKLKKPVLSKKVYSQDFRMLC